MNITNMHVRIFVPIVFCGIYKNAAQKFVEENARRIEDPIKARFEFFKNKLEIISRGYRTGYREIN